MKGKPQDYMKIGIVHFMAFPETITGEGAILESIETLCKDDYFQVIEVTRIKDASVRSKAIETVRSAGKVVGFGAQPVILLNKLNPNSLDEGERRQAVSAVCDALPEAYEWEAAGFALLSGTDPDAEKRQQATAALVQSLKEICAESRKLGDMPVLLETFDRKPFGKNCLIGPTVEAVAVAEQVRAEFPSFGLLLDLSHLPLLEETPKSMLETAREFLKHVHIGNCVMRDPNHPAYGDGHPAFGIAGGENGVEELAEFLRVLGEIGYIGEGKQNIVSFEIKPYGDETPDDVIRNAKETMQAAWEKV